MRGDRVAVWATNVPEWIVLQFALAKIGAILVTVNTSLRAREIEYLLRQSETSTLFTIAGFKGVDYMAELRERDAPSASEARVLHRRSVSGGRDAVCAAPRRSRARCLNAALDAARSRGRRRRRDQHAIHVGHDRLSQGRHALEPEHRQQRLLDRRGARLHAGGSPVLVRAAVPLLRLRARRARGLHARRLFVPARILRCRRARSKSSIAKSARRSTACRRCSSPSSSIPTSLASTPRHCAPASWPARSVPEPLMRRVIDQMKMRELTIVYGLTETSPGLTQTPRDADLDRAHADRRPRDAGNRSAHRRSGNRRRCASSAPTASCGRAATS